MSVAVNHRQASVADNMLKIETNQTSIGSSYTAPLYSLAIDHLIQSILPKDLLQPNLKDLDHLQDQQESFNELLPCFTYTCEEKGEDSFSFTFLFKTRPHAFTFTFELLSRWLCPGRRLNVTNVFAADLRLPDLLDQVLTIGEIIIKPSSETERLDILRNIPLIESEIRLGVQSKFLAWRILEAKGLNSDEKTVIILEQINYLIRRKPQYFDVDLITEMQHMLVMFRDDFVAKHESRYLTRLVSTQYIYRKELWQAVHNDASERHLKLKLFKARLLDTENPRIVLGILLAVNFISDNEFFEEKHLLKAIRNYISSVIPVEGSFISHRRGSEKVCTIYMEIEKEDGLDFNSQELSLLRNELPYDLRDRIEHIMHPVFMPRNEEDIMRNILSLSSQIKYVRDVPQVFISFEEQTKTSLVFCIIVVQVCMPGSPSLQELFQYADTSLEYIPDRCKMVGMLRKKYAKQATVCRVKLDKHNFMRNDGSLDLNKGRQFVVQELVKIIGDFRDFNGGMISKQNEQFCLLRQNLEGSSRFNELLLENFFYSLTPVSMRTVLDANLLTKLFILLGESVDEKLFINSTSIYKVLEEPEALLVIVSAESRQIIDELNRISHDLHLGLEQLAHSYVQVYNVPYFCFVNRTHEQNKRQEFLAHLEVILNHESVLA